MPKSPNLPLLNLPLPLSATSHSPYPASPRTRSASLSLARSPLLSPATSISAPTIAHSRGTSYTSLYPGGGGDALGRISDADEGEAENRAAGAKGHQRGQSRNGFGIESRTGSDNDSDARQSLELAELERDIEAMDGGVGVGAGIDGPLLRNSADASANDYAGPFQPPKGNERTAIALSITAVGVLAVVACLTTVYDWVL